MVNPPRMTTTTPAPSGAAIAPAGCAHREFSASVNVHSGFHDGAASYAATLSVRCRQCGQPFVFENGQATASLSLFPSLTISPGGVR